MSTETPINTRYVCPECGIEVISASDSVALSCAACGTSFTAKPQLIVTTETKQAWTRGPWKTGIWTSHGQMIRGPQQQFIGYAQGYPALLAEEFSVSEAEAESNAALISKAPEMAELLQKLIDSWSKGNQIGIHSDYAREAERLLADLEAK